MFEAEERAALAGARVARLATADGEGRPSVIPICFALRERRDEPPEIVTPIDEKPQSAGPASLRRVRNVRANPQVALVVDHYTEEWDRLGWVLVRGTAAVREPGTDGHDAAVAALRRQYDQYASHALEDRPVIAIAPGSVRSWGDLTTLAG